MTTELLHPPYSQMGSPVAITPMQVGGRTTGSVKVLGDGSMESINFVSGSAGWRFDGQGNLEANDGNFRGDISGASGTFTGSLSGADITGATGTFSGALAASSIDIGGTDATSWHVDSAGNMWWGSAGSYAAASIKISSTGQVTFTSGTFSGSITGASGTFSGDLAIGSGNNITKIDSNGLYVGNATFASAPFSVTQAGVTKMTSATVEGDVTVSSGGSVRFSTNTYGFDSGYIIVGPDTRSGLYSSTFFDDISVMGDFSDNTENVQGLGGGIGLDNGRALMFFYGQNLVTESTVLDEITWDHIALINDASYLGIAKGGNSVHMADIELIYMDSDMVFVDTDVVLANKLYFNTKTINSDDNADEYWSFATGDDYIEGSSAGIRFFVGGTQRMEINSNGTLEVGTASRFPSGSASAPSHSFVSDTDTGMFLNAVSSFVGIAYGGSTGLAVRSGDVVPGSDNTKGLGVTSLRWVDVWAVDGSINTSDERRKVRTGDVPGLAFVRDMADATMLGRWDESMSNDGQGVRTDLDHFWMGAQSMQKVLRKHGYTEVGLVAKGNSRRDWSARYVEMIPPVVKSIDELAARVDALEAAAA